MRIYYARTNTKLINLPMNSKQECIPVGCVSAARRPYAGVCFPGGGLLPGGLLLGGGGCLLGGSAPGEGGLLLRGGG